MNSGGATTRITLPVSAGLLTDTDAYFDALSAYRRGNPNSIIRRFSQASFAAVVNGRVLADALHQVYQQWSRTISARTDAVVWKVLPLLVSHPAATSKVLQDKTGVSQPAADNALTQLREAGVVQKASGVQRNIVWTANEVIDALDGFAERARRG